MNHDIYIDGFIGQSDFFSEGFSAKTLRDKIALAPDADELTIHINSGGGSVIEGFAIHDALATSGKKVNTRVEGLCGSIATIIAQSNTGGGKRSITKNSTYFIHNPYWTPDAPVPMEASELEALAESLKSNEDKIASFYADKTGKNIDFIKEKMASTSEFTADEAKDFGFVDTVIGEAKAFQKHIINSNGKEYRFAAFIQHKNHTMDILKAFKDFESKITSLITPKVSNMVAKTTDGKEIFHDGPLAVGTVCFTDAAMTQPCPDGDVTIGTKVYTIAGGKIASEKDVAAAAADPLQAEIDALKASLAAKEAELTATKN